MNSSTYFPPGRSSFQRGRHLLVLFVLLVSAIGLHGQSTVTINVNPGTTANAPLGFANYHVSEHIYLVSEVGQNMTIGRINFDMTTMGVVPAWNTFNNVALYLMHTPATTLGTGAYSTAGYTLVYNGTMVWNTTGYAGVDLTTPFNYIQASGNLRLLVVRTDNVSHNDGVNAPAFAASIGNSTSSAALTSRRYNGAAAPVSGSTSLTSSAFRSAIQLVSFQACAGTPAPGNTTSTVTGACAGQNFVVGIENYIGTGATYTWERDNGGGWVSFGTNAATQTVTQAVPTSYRVTVNCPSGGGSPTSATSSPILVPMATPFPVEFTQQLFPSNCWTRSGTGSFATTLVRNAANGYALAGSGSARWSFYDATAGDVLTLASPLFSAVPSDQQIRFDAAGTTYTTGEIDHIHLETSTNGIGGPWTLVADMTNASGGVLNTVPPQTGPFTPTLPSHWTTLTYPLATGTNAVRFRGVSSFGNHVYLDNIMIEAVPSCLAPTGVTAGISTTTTATINWTAVPGVTSYDVEVRQGGAPGTGGAAFIGNTPNANIVATGLVFGEMYQVYVRSNCAGMDPGPWSSPASLLMDYCQAGAENTNPANDPTISNVNFAGIGHNSTNTAAYVDLTALVGEVAPGGTYPLSLTRTVNYTMDQFLIWIDWNDDYDFTDPGEAVLVSPIGIPNPFLGSINVPEGTTPGDKRMRIRRHYSDPGIGFEPNNTPCGNATFGQVIDLTITVCEPIIASASVLDDCINSTFDVVVDITNNAGGPLSIEWLATPGGPGSMAAALGSNQIPVSFPAGTNVSLTVSNGTACILALDDQGTACPIIVDCDASTAMTMNHCYTNNDGRTFTFKSSDPGNTLVFKFLQPSPIAAGDGVTFFDGELLLGPQISLPPAGGDLSSLATITSTGNTLSFNIQSDASGSCVDGGVNDNWTFQVRCAGCSEPSADPIVTTDCNTLTFNLMLDLWDLGFSEITDGPATSASIRYVVNNGTPVIISNVTEDIHDLGDFPNGSIVHVTVLHQDDGACDLVLGNFTNDQICPPVNDQCANATVLLVNSPAECPGNATQGTTIMADLSGTAPGCTAGNIIQDVWYAFNSGDLLMPIAMNTTLGTANNIGVELFTACGTPVAGACLTNAQGIVNVTVASNTTYWLRLFTRTDVGPAGTFSICLSGNPPPTCGDDFYDSGGQAGNYGNNQDITYVICPDISGTVASVTFNSFNIENGWDFMFVHNGNSIASPQISGSPFTGTNSPGTVTSTDPSGCLTFRFVSDGTETAPGWEAVVNCPPAPTCAPPSGVAVTQLTATTALIDWVGTPGNYIIEYGPTVSFTTPGTGATAGTGGTVINTSVWPYEITGLTDGSAYRIFVRRDCTGDAGGFSDNSAELVFNTSGCINSIAYGNVVAPIPGNSATVVCAYAEEYSTFTSAVLGQEYSVTSTIGSDFLTIRSGTPGGIMVAAGTGPITFTAPANADLFVHVSTNAACGTQQICRDITMTASGSTEAPANDDCANATVLIVNSAGECPTNAVIGTTVGSSQDGVNVSCDTGGPYADVWYSFNSGSNSEVAYDLDWITMAGGTSVELYSGCAGTALSCDLFFSAPFTNTWSVSPNTNYLVRISTNMQFDTFGEFTLCLSSPAFVSVNSRAFLDGPYNTGTTLMADNLRSQGLIPTAQPYSGAPWNYAGTETVDPSAFTVTGNDALVDWVLLELRDEITPSTVIARRAALVQRDGSIVDTDGVSPVEFTAIASGNYHLAVRHRNHLGAMTAATYALSQIPTDIDLTTISVATYGMNARRDRNGVMTLWGGNANPNGLVNYNGLNNDRQTIVTLLGPTTILTPQSGYYTQDVTMNGLVNYNGLNNDRQYLVGVLGASTILSPRVQQLP